MANLKVEIWSWFGADAGVVENWNIGLTGNIGADANGANNGAQRFIQRVRVCRYCKHRHKKHCQIQTHHCHPLFFHPAKVRCIRILPRLDNALANGSCAGEIIMQMIPVTGADGTLQREQLFCKTAQNFQRGLFVI